MDAFRSRSLVPALLTCLLALSAAGCSAAPGEATDSSASDVIYQPRPSPITFYAGPSHSPSALAFGNVEPSIHYEQTARFLITQADNFSARINGVCLGARKVPLARLGYDVASPFRSRRENTRLMVVQSASIRITP